MPKLGDLIGNIISEISLARAQGDAQTVRIAKYYAEEQAKDTNEPNYLAYMSVPRFKLPEVEIELPLAIPESEANKQITTIDGKQAISTVMKKYNTILSRYAESGKLQLSHEQISKVSTSIVSKVKSKHENLISNIKPQSFANSVADTTRNELFKMQQSAGIEVRNQEQVLAEIRAVVQKSLLTELLNYYDKKNRLDVSVLTEDIKQAGVFGARLKFKMVEDAVEWIVERDSDGKIISRKLIDE